MSNQEYKDGAWHWVERDGGLGQPPTIQPAMYRAKTDDWQSAQFFGLSTRFLTVLEPCARVQELEAQRVPLTPSEVSGLLESAGYWQGDMQRADFINGLRHGEMAHGITQQVAPQPETRES